MTAFRRVILVCLCFFSNTLFAQAPEPAPGDPQVQAVSGEIENLLASRELAIDGVDILSQSIANRIYADNDYQPFWGDTGNIRELVALIGEAPDHGLLTGDYNFDQLVAVLSEKEKEPITLINAESDILLTESLLRYGYHRGLGKVKASSLDPDINYKRLPFRNQNPSETMRELLEAPTLQGYVDLAAPAGPFYQSLQKALKHYRQLALQGGWPAVPEGSTLRLGDKDSRIAIIRARLAVTSDLPGDQVTASTEFDESLKAAVAAFQYRHALDADGIVGARTLAAMNVPAETRVNQLRLSLERIRWVNQEAKQTFVVVNIASFNAYLYRDGERIWSTRAMVGKDYRRTPIFRGDIQYLEFNPTWTIPPGILRNDTLPAIKRDPNYLAANNIRVIDSVGNFIDPSTVDWTQFSKGIPYTLRQEPGPENSLGKVKFIFPNKHFVFLHDTPHPELFDRPERAFSSGCIRIQNPLELAELLLDEERYSLSALEKIVNSRQTQRVVLTTPIPVIILYLTASLDENENIMFYKDIYNKDAIVLKALDGPVILELPSI